MQGWPKDKMTVVQGTLYLYRDGCEMCPCFGIFFPCYQPVSPSKHPPTFTRFLRTEETGIKRYSFTCTCNYEFHRHLTQQHLRNPQLMHSQPASLFSTWTRVTMRPHLVYSFYTATSEDVPILTLILPQGSQTSHGALIIVALHHLYCASLLTELCFLSSTCTVLFARIVFCFMSNSLPQCQYYQKLFMNNLWYYYSH